MAFIDEVASLVPCAPGKGLQNYFDTSVSRFVDHAAVARWIRMYSKVGKHVYNRISQACMFEILLAFADIQNRYSKHELFKLLHMCNYIPTIMLL